jgi:hypothetical protein
VVWRIRHAEIKLRIRQFLPKEGQMREEAHGPSDEARQGETQASDEYVRPELTDIGSFEELTRLNPQGPGFDSEGFSGTSTTS